MSNYIVLKQGLEKFRELFSRGLLAPRVVSGKETFLKSIRAKEIWTQSDAFKVYSIIKPYKSNMLKIGFNLDIIPPISTAIKPKAVKSLKYRSIQKKLIGYDKEAFVVFFPYDAHIVGAIRLIPGAEWKNEKKYWNVPLAKINELRKFAERFKFKYTDKGRSMITNMAENYNASYKAEKVDLDLPMKLDPYPFQYAGIDYGMKNKRVIIADEMGCIVGDAIINANVGGNSFKMRLDDLYIKFKHSTVKHKFKARSLKDNIFGLNKIDNIIYKGVKETYDIETKSGKLLCLTLDHEILTPNGYVELEKLKEGDSIIINGKLVCKDEDCDSDKDIITYKFSKFLGYCKSCMYSKYRRNGRYIKGKFIDKDGYVRLTGYQHHPRSWSGGQVYEHIIVMEEYLKIMIPLTFDVHHKNGNRSDNRIENLELLTRSKHHIEHNKFLNFGLHIEPKEDTIISIKYAGKKPVYDMVMAEPYRNFVANGIVVHNCGKTPQAIGIALGLDSFPVLVICPKSLRLNWKNEWEKFSHKKAMILDRKNIKNFARYYELGMFQVAITNYEGARTLFTKEIHEIEIHKGPRAGKTNKKIILHGYEKQFKTVITDEIHNCRNSKTIRYKTIKPVMAAADVRLGLTGSPIVKGTGDLASLLELIGRIDDFGGHYKFVRKYNKFKKESFHAKALPANLKELNIKLRSLCFIRREKIQVLKELPDKIIQIVKIDLDNKKEYDEAFNAFRFWLDNQGYDQEKIDRAMRAEMLVKIGVLKRLSARGKLSAFSEFVDEVMLSGEKLVVFCWHKETANYLKANFDNVLLITGDVSDEELEANKKKFQEDPKYKMIVCTFKKGGEGHNLTASNKVAIIEPGWTHKDHSQAIDRTHRIGQDKTVNAYYFIGEDTIDEDIYDVIEQRRLMEKEATGGQTDLNISISKRIAKKAMEMEVQNET